MTVSPILPAGLEGLAAASPATLAPAAGPHGAFARLLFDGVQEVDRTVMEADRLVQAFALDDSVPLHQVTFALEQARLATELMLQVRSRLLEGYQEIMRMQL